MKRESPIASSDAEEHGFTAGGLHVTIAFTPNAPSLQSLLFCALRTFPEITAGNAEASYAKIEAKSNDDD